MSHKIIVKDANGHDTEISLTAEESKRAIANDFEAMVAILNPKYVTVERLTAKSGEALHLKITVHAPSHYLTSATDTQPKATDSMSVEVVVKPGYPIEHVEASYPSNRFLASPNVFNDGGACIDTWIPFESSLANVVRKLVNDIVHNPQVTRYDSVARGDAPTGPMIVQWHKDGVRNGQFPTVDPKKLFLRPLPPKREPNIPAMPVRPLPPKPIR